MWAGSRSPSGPSGPRASRWCCCMGWASRARCGRGNLYAKALAGLYRTAADGAFQAVLRSEPGFPAVAGLLGGVQVDTLVIAADPALDAALGEEAAQRVVEMLPKGRLLTIPGA